MDGHIAPLKDICDLAEKYDALVMVDECHATGFMGRTGRGTDEHWGVQVCQHNEWGGLLLCYSQVCTIVVRHGHGHSDGLDPGMPWSGCGRVTVNCSCLSQTINHGTDLWCVNTDPPVSPLATGLRVTV